MENSHLIPYNRLLLPCFFVTQSKLLSCHVGPLAVFSAIALLSQLAGESMNHWKRQNPHEQIFVEPRSPEKVGLIEA